MEKYKPMKWTLGNINNITDRTPGIYIFWMEVRDGWSCIYIGEAICLKKRLTDHWKRPSSAGVKFCKHKKIYEKYYHFCYRQADSDEKKRREFESRLINQLKPRKNTKKPKSSL